MGGSKWEVCQTECVMWSALLKPFLDSVGGLPTLLIVALAIYLWTEFRALRREVREVKAEVREDRKVNKADHDRLVADVSALKAEVSALKAKVEMLLAGSGAEA